MTTQTTAAGSIERSRAMVGSATLATVESMTVIASAGMTVDNIVRTTSYLRDPAFAEANQNARVAALGGRTIHTTTIAAQTLSEAWLVEIEVIAAA